MKKQVIIQHPNWFKLMKNAKTLNMKVDKFEMSMQFDDDVMKALDENPVIQQKLWDAASKEWKAMLAKLDNKISDIEEDLEDAVGVVGGNSLEAEKKKITKNGMQDLNAILQKGESDMEKAVEKAWEKIKKQKKLSKKFKIFTAFKAVGKCLSLTTSIASLVVSGGVNVLAYVTLARTLVSGYKDMKKLTMNLDKLGKKLEADVNKLSKNVYAHPKISGAKEVANTVTFLVLGADVLKSHAAIMKDVATYRARVASLQQKQIGQGKDIKKLMDKISSEKKKVDKNTLKKMEKLEAKLNDLLVKTSDLGAKFSENDANAETLSKRLTELKGAKGAKILNVSKMVSAQVIMVGKIALNAFVLDAAGVSDAIVAMAEDVAKAA